MNRRDILFSIQPAYAEQILNGQKTVELRRRFTDAPLSGSRAFFYATSPASAIVGYADIQSVRRMEIEGIWNEYHQAIGIDRTAFERYFAGAKSGYAIVLEHAARFDVALALADLRRKIQFTPPQSFCYAPPICRAACSKEGKP